MQSIKLPLIIIVCGLLLVVILTKANDAYAQWIIPSQLNEAYKNAQHYSSNSNSSSTASIPTAIGQDHNSTTSAITIAIEKHLLHQFRKISNNNTGLNALIIITNKSDICYRYMEQLSKMFA
jgi:hypothetical protein